MKSKQNLVWIDLEMTGLDPAKESILEIATIVTDKNLNILAEGPDLVVHQPTKLLKKMDEWNQKQHKKSGLVDAVKASKISVKKAEKLTLDFIKEFCVEKKANLCGNAIYHDRKFIAKYMPKLNAFFHYRLIDVSSIKELLKRWYPKDKSEPKKSKGHRALTDIRESIAELRHYRENYFRK